MFDFFRDVHRSSFTRRRKDALAGRRRCIPPRWRPAPESLEERLALAVAEIGMVSATAVDSRTVAFEFAATGVNASVNFGIYRSSDKLASAGDVSIATQAVLVSASSPRVGSLVVPGGLSPDPDRPYILVVADPGYSLAEADEGNIAEADEGNNSASIRQVTIGAVTHGFDLSGETPDWIDAMAEALPYDVEIPYSWAETSNDPVRGRAVEAGRGMAGAIVAAARSALNSFAGESLSFAIHVIGHSRGGVVINEAMKVLTVDPLLDGAYKKETMLDPHPARNYWFSRYYSAAPVVGTPVELALIAFQAGAQDPSIVVPRGVDVAEVFYQRTPWYLTFDVSESILNIWGERPGQGGAASYRALDLTRPGIGHGGVRDWYRESDYFPRSSAIGLRAAGSSFAAEGAASTQEVPIPVGAAGAGWPSETANFPATFAQDAVETPSATPTALARATSRLRRLDLWLRDAALEDYVDLGRWAPDHA